MSNSLHAHTHSQTGSLQPLLGSALLKIRTPLLNLLVDLYEQCKSGHFQIVMLEGVEGMGKTHLAQIFLKWAATRTAAVFNGRAVVSEEHIPYQPLLGILQKWTMHEAIGSYLPTLPWSGELLRLMPTLAGRYPDLAPSVEEDEEKVRSHLAQAVAALGLTIARTTPLVLCLDDIQWANASSLALLSAIANLWQKHAAPILLLFCLRPDIIQSRPLLASWHAHMQQPHLPTSSLSLTPLTFQQVVDFTRKLAAQETTLTATQSETLGRWLASEIQGNPLRLMETLRILLAHNLIELQQQAADSWLVNFKHLIRNAERWMEILPPGMYYLIRSRLKLLTPHATSLLAAAATYGHDLTFARLLALTGLPKQSGREALDELVNEQYLASETDTTYEFTHECIRQIVWAQISNKQKALFHRRAMTFLQREEAAPALIVRHALGAQLHEQAFHSAVAAGDAAMQPLALQDAITFYSQAERTLIQLIKQTPTVEHLQVASIEHMYLQLARAYQYTHNEENVYSVFRSMNTRAKKLRATAMQCLALNLLAAHSLHAWSDAKAAQNYLNEAQQLIETIADDPERQKMLRIETALHLAQLGNLYLTKGNERNALHAFQHAARLIQQLANNIPDEQQRAIFLSTQQMQDILHKSQQG